ncbi:MAG: hypothetical protein JKY33_09475 [Bacteroidia bacterium]|nr:hypothetical protein [Bacteroidia bacterium]
MLSSPKRYLIIIGFLVSAQLTAQDFNNLKSKTVQFVGDSVKLDSLSIIPGSVIIQNTDGNVIPDSVYHINFSNSIFKWVKKIEIDSFKVSYRVLPYAFGSHFYKKPTSLIDKNEEYIENPFFFSYKNKSEEDVFGFGELKRNGSIARGITIGNNQDLVVNSHLNLQLAGKLSDDMEIIAAITDANIPFQPEGNTQQLQEFDKVFIQLKHTKGSMVVGDFAVNSQDGYFMKLNKKVQGGSISSKKYKISSKEYMKTSASYAVSKGKYSKQEIKIEEGNQGPYRLLGNNGETFIIVLSGTERVFIDGEKMVRGEEHDYTINYNTAEITFTANRLITKDSRVIIEFEYSDKNYVRSLLHLTNEYERNKLKISFNMVSEQDNKNKPFEQEISDSQKDFLEQVGDSLQNALIKSIDSTGFITDRVMYQLVDSVHYDSIVGGFISYDSVLVYSTDPNLALYQSSFSYVGDNNGNYKQKITSINGRIFEWKTPVAGIPQGDYEPIKLLITPKQQQLYTLGAQYTFSENSILTLESALSNNDINQFSKKHGSDDVGKALKLSYNFKRTLGKSKADSTKNSKKWIFQTRIHAEYVDKYFKPIENYRPIEFTRDWNLNGIQQLEDELISSINVGLSKQNTGRVNYKFTSFNKGTIYNANKNAIFSDLRWKKLHFKTRSSLLNATLSNSKTQFIRPMVDVSRTFKYWIFGLKGDFEENRITDLASNQLSNKSFKYDLYKIYLRNNDSLKNKFELDYTQRKDYAPFNDQFSSTTLGKTFNFKTELMNNTKNQLRVGATYRELTISNSTLSAIQPDKSLLSRVEYNTTLRKGFLRLRTYYELGTGQEQKRLITFERVIDGRGVFIYTGDANENGFNDVEEYEIARAGEPGDYIRIIIPTNEYIESFTNKFSQSLYLKPAALWRGQTGIKKFISRFSDQAILKIDRKTQDTDPAVQYNPLILNVSDTSLLSLNSIIRNSIFFNRSNPKWGFDFNFNDSRNKILLLSGFNSRSLNEYSLRIRWNLSKVVNLNLSLKDGDKVLTSEISPTKNYIIQSQKVSPQISIQPNTKYRITLFYDWWAKSNIVSLGGEKSLSQEIGSEFRFAKLKKGNLNGKISYIGINYTGDENSPRYFEMLDGLKAGNNITWQISFQKHLNDNMQLSINYNGRKSEDINMIHTGSVQVRAMF